MLAQIIIGKGNVVKETEKAMLFDFGRGSVWMPKSQISVELPDDPTLPGALTMPIWLAKKAGLWGYTDRGRRICQLVEA